MGRRPGEHHPKAGRYQRNPPRETYPPPGPVIRGERVELTVGPGEPTYFWSSDGTLHLDPELTVPADDLAIVRVLREWDWREGIPQGTFGVLHERLRMEPGRREIYVDENGNILDADGSPTGQTIVRLTSVRRGPNPPARPLEPSRLGPRRSPAAYATVEDDEDDN